MEFKFSTKDKIEELHPDIKKHLGAVIKNRVDDYQNTKDAFASNDFESIRNFCHKLEGVAASYHLFRMDEIIRYIHHYAKDEDIGKINQVIPIFEDYLEEIQSYI